MRKTIFVTLLTGSVLLASQQLVALDNNALYQWVGPDGTPTYSPEPPPAGVEYVVVDADLNPLPVQPPRPEAAAAAGPTTPSPAALPAPNKSIPKWKPVRYAADPNAQSGESPVKPATAVTAPAAVTDKPVAATVDTTCRELQQERKILEGYFAQAATATEMDRAILKLQEKTNAYKRQCS